MLLIAYFQAYCLCISISIQSDWQDPNSKKKTGSDFFFSWGHSAAGGLHDQVETMNNLQDLMDASVECVIRGGPKP